MYIYVYTYCVYAGRCLTTYCPQHSSESFFSLFFVFGTQASGDARQLTAPDTALNLFYFKKNLIFLFL